VIPEEEDILIGKEIILERKGYTENQEIIQIVIQV